jgi:hypothetical protein
MAKLKNAEKKVYPLNKHKKKKGKLLSPSAASQRLSGMAVDTRQKWCKVRKEHVVEYKVPYKTIYQDTLSQVRKKDCDPQGVTQIANEIAHVDQERGFCVRPYESDDREISLAITWGNTGFRGIKKINNDPDNFMIEDYELGFAWVNIYNKPLGEMKQWQHKENNSHSYHKNCADEDNLEAFQDAIASGKLDKPGSKFEDLTERPKRQRARDYVKEWLDRSLPHFTSLWKKYKKRDPNSFKTKSHQVDEIKSELSRINAFGMTGQDDNWKNSQISTKSKIGGIFKTGNVRTKVSVLSSTYPTKGAAFQHAYQALYVDKVAEYSVFVVSIEGADTKDELDAVRQEFVDAFIGWNNALPGVIFVHEVRFLNQCTQTETNSSKPYARVEKL